MPTIAPIFGPHIPHRNNDIRGMILVSFHTGDATVTLINARHLQSAMNRAPRLIDPLTITSSARLARDAIIRQHIVHPAIYQKQEAMQFQRFPGKLYSSHDVSV